MKHILIAVLGATMAFAPSVEARDRHDRHHRHSRHEYREGRYYAPPYYTRRHWHRGRVYSWNGNRYHWHNGAWVIFSPIGRVVVYR